MKAKSGREIKNGAKKDSLAKCGETQAQKVEYTFEIQPSRTDTQALVKQARSWIAPGGFVYPIIRALDDIKYQALHDRILVLQAEPREQIGHIIVPDVAKEKLNVGVVVRVGKGHREGTELVPLQVEAGQVVNWSKNYGTPVEIAGYKLLQLRECEIHGAAG